MQEADTNSRESTGEPSAEKPKESKRARAKRLQAERLLKDPEAPYGRYPNGAPRGKTGPKPAPLARPDTVYTPSANQERINEAMDLMRSMEFIPGKTSKELARKWGISWNYAKHLTAVAWKNCREEVTNADQVGTTIGEALSKIVREGMESKKYEHKKLVILAAKLWSEISPGLRAPAEHHVVASRQDALPDDPEELRRIAKKLIEHEAREAQKLAVEVLK